MTMGSQVRTEMLHQLSRRAMTALDLAHAVGTSHVSVHRHLVVLEDQGLVEASLPRGQRVGGVQVTWVARVDAVRRTAEAWADYASGKDSPQEF